jgi:molybdopterin molybdotransferase
MQINPSCMDDSDPDSLPADVALAKILSAIQPVQEEESVPLHTALNRVLAADLTATMDVPPAANSAMDGYAFNAADIPKNGTKTLKIAGTSWAGKPYGQTVQAGTCVRIMTGGLMPGGTDTVAIQEQVQLAGDVITIDTRQRKHDNVRKAGENFSKGDLLIQAGRYLCPADLGLIASLGMGEIRVKRRVRVAFFPTGDELRSAGETLDDGSIYNSNSYTLHGMLTRLGVDITDLGIVRDNRDAIEKALLTAAGSADAIITSGGVSVGDADFVREILHKTGKVDFWKVAMKPGRPLAFGKVRESWFFGLPGNPVSSMVTFYQFVQPALKKLMGIAKEEPLTLRVTCVSNLKKRPGRVEYQRGILQRDKSGDLVVSKTGAQGSGILSSMTQANCFIILPMENDGVMAGDMVEVQLFAGLI